MKYMLGVFIALLLSSFAHAEWTLFSDGEHIYATPDWFFYMDEPKRNGDFFTVRILQSASTESGVPGPQSAIWLVTIDCKKRKEKATELYEYAMRMGEGPGKKKENMDFEPIGSRGFAYILWKTYCK